MKIRIAIAVDPTGNWNACGWKGMDVEHAMNLACEGVDPGEAQYWVEAEVEVPKPNVIQGGVTNA